MSGEYEIPFDTKGNLLTYVGSYTKGVTWRSNYEFDAEITFVGMNRGRSAAHFICKDERGREFAMFMADLFDLMPKVAIVKGRALGRWTFRKRGQNYGLRLAKWPNEMPAQEGVLRLPMSAKGA